MRTFLTIIIGLWVLGVLGVPQAEALNILVREVRRERQAEVLSVVYELQNASVDRWDLRRIEAHIFDDIGRRIELLRPVTTLTRLERDDVELIRIRIPSALVPEAHHLELRLFLEEFLRFPVADPPLKRLVYSFPLRPQTTPAPLVRGRRALRVERPGMVQASGGRRAILLRLINHGRETLSHVILLGKISGVSGTTLHKFQLPITPRHLSPGAEAYVSIPVPKPIVNRAKGISLQAVYRKTGTGRALQYVEDLEVDTNGGEPKPAPREDLKVVRSEPH